MTITLELPPELEHRLRVEAAQRGMSVEDYAVMLITQALDKLDAERRERIDAE